MTKPLYRKYFARLFTVLALALAACVSLPNLTTQTPTAAVEIADFTTDGCSLFPEGSASQPKLWHHCCVSHDQAYWPGGTAEERSAADDALKACVAATDSTSTAKLMWLGVRAAGGPQWQTKFRWGYGWPYLRPYQALDANEKKMVMEKWEKYLQQTAATKPMTKP